MEKRKFLEFPSYWGSMKTGAVFSMFITTTSLAQCLTCSKQAIHHCRVIKGKVWWPS